MKRQISLGALFLAAVSGLAMPANAGTIWDGDDSSTIWSRPNNWSGNEIPVFDSSVILEFATAESAALIDTNYDVGSILFNRDGPFTINNSGTNPFVLTLHSGISTGTAQSAGQDYTLAVKIALGNNNTWTVNMPFAGGTNSLTLSTSGKLDLASYQLTVDGSGLTSLDGTISGATGSIYKSGGGTLSIGNLNSTFAGGMTVAEGTVGFNDISVNGASAGSGPLFLIGGKVCTDTNGGGVTLKTSSVSIQNTVEFGTGLVGNRQLNFTGLVAIADGAVLNFSNVVGNEFSGLTTLHGNITANGVGAGAAQFIGGLALGGASRRITIDRSAGSVAFSGPLGGDVAGLDLTFAGSAPGAKVGLYLDPVSDAAGMSPVRIVVDATGIVTFDNSNTYSAGTLIKAGTVKMSGGNVSPVTKGPFGTGTLTLQGGILANFYNGGGTVLHNPVDVTGSFEYATLDYNRMLWFSGPVTFSGDPTVTHNGNMGTSSDLVFNGAVQLNSNVTFAGTHTGELEVKSTGLNLGGIDRTLTFNDAGTGPTSVKSTLTGTAARLTINGTRDLEAYFNGATAHSVEYAGTATYTLRGDTSDYTGGTFISGGATVKLYPYGYGSDSGRALPATSSLTVSDLGSTFDMNNWLQELSALTMTGGNVINSFVGSTRILGMQGNVTSLAAADTATISCNMDVKGATRTFTVADGTTATDLLISGNIIKGAVADHAGLSKQGAGRMVLTGANSFDHAIDIYAGTLAAGNNAALGTSAITVKNSGKLEILAGTTITNPTAVEAGGTIGGSGTYQGSLTIPAGGFLAPGSSPGTFTVDGNLSATPGCTLLWELGDTLDQYDRVAITGSLIPGHGGTDITVHLDNLADLDPTGQTFTFVTWAGTDPIRGTNWDFDYGTTGWTGGVILSDRTDSDQVPGGYYRISGLTVVPEPSALALLGLGGMLLLTRCRSRIRK